ncbi:MAG: hypothetical protein Q7J72_05480 [Candidatus Omnitrophota bacterium]|nr:hypothetical protein [Candidatus Omnitrophota bacterium]
MDRPKKRKIILIMAVGIFIICGISRADEDKKSKRVVARIAKEIQGEVAGISKDSIAIVYNRNETTGEEYEMSFPVAKEVGIEHKKSIKEIAVGDTVNVQYEEVTEKYTEDEEKDPEINRKVKVITFLRSAVKVAESAEADSEEEESPFKPLKTP